MFRGTALPSSFGGVLLALLGGGRRRGGAGRREREERRAVDIGRSFSRGRRRRAAGGVKKTKKSSVPCEDTVISLRGGTTLSNDGGYERKGKGIDGVQVWVGGRKPSAVPVAREEAPRVAPGGPRVR